MKKDLNSIFNFLLDDMFEVKTHTVKTEEDFVTLSIIAPGHKKENFSIELKGDKLYISMPEDTKKVFRIPSSVFTEDISAVYEAGILKIKFSKKEVETRKITIS